MRFKKWLKQIDPLTYVVIWTNDYSDNEDPAFSGWISDIPWYFMDMKIGRPKSADTDEAPIYFTRDLGAEYKNREGIVVNLLVNHG